MIAVKHMAFREPAPDAALNLAKKVEIALDSQMSKIAYQIGDGIFVTRAAAMLKHGKRIGSRGNVFGSTFISSITRSRAAQNGKRRTQSMHPPSFFPDLVAASVESVVESIQPQWPRCVVVAPLIHWKRSHTNRQPSLTNSSLSV